MFKYFHFRRTEVFPVVRHTTVFHRSDTGIIKFFVREHEKYGREIAGKNYVYVRTYNPVILRKDVCCNKFIENFFGVMCFSPEIFDFFIVLCDIDEM